MLHIHCWKADTHIVEQQCQWLRVQPNECVFQPLAYFLRHGLVFLFQAAVILLRQSGFKSHILFGYANLHPFFLKLRYPSPVLQFYLRFRLILFKVLRSSPILSDLYPPVRERGFRRLGAANAAPNAPFRAVGFRAARRRTDGARAQKSRSFFQERLATAYFFNFRYCVCTQHITRSEIYDRSRSA